MLFCVMGDSSELRQCSGLKCYKPFQNQHAKASSSSLASRIGKKAHYYVSPRTCAVSICKEAIVATKQQSTTQNQTRLQTVNLLSRSQHS